MGRNIKITLFGENVGFQCGGAEKSTFELLSNLEQTDLQVIYYADEKSEQRLALLPYPRSEKVHLFRSCKLPYVQYFLNWLRRKEIVEKIRDSDLLLAQGIPASIAINAFPGKAVYFIMDESALNKSNCYEVTQWRKIKFWIRYIVQLPFYVFYCIENRRAIKKSRLICTHSNYIAREVYELFQCQAEPVYPSINFKKYKRTLLPAFADREYIVMIGDYEYKGIYTFERIAEYFKEENFLVVGKKYSYEKKGNITYQSYVDDPLEIYKKAKIVLMPSIWEEAFGMVAVEASLLGIPVLVSDRGGLPETVPVEYVVKEYKNVHAWVEKLKMILGNPDQYIDAAKEHVAQYDDQGQYRKWIRLIEKTTSIKIT